MLERERERERQREREREERGERRRWRGRRGGEEESRCCGGDVAQHVVLSTASLEQNGAQPSPRQQAAPHRHGALLNIISHGDVAENSLSLSPASCSWREGREAQGEGTVQPVRALITSIIKVLG